MKDFHCITICTIYCSICHLSLVLSLTLCCIKYLSFVSVLVPCAGWCHVKLASSTHPLCCEQRLTGKWNLCYIEAAILILSMVLCTGVMGTSDVMLIHQQFILISIALTSVSCEAELSLESWLFWGQTWSAPRHTKAPVVNCHLVSYSSSYVYLFVLTHLNYAALTWIAIQCVVLFKYKSYKGYVNGTFMD